MKQEYREAFTEVNEIIKLMPIELVKKIPSKFREMVEEERDKNYLPDIKEPLEKCKLKNETIIILGLIYRDFLCLPEERKKLQEKDAKDLQEIQKAIEDEIRQKYNPDDLFKNKKNEKLNYKEETEEIEKTEETEEKRMVIVQEEKWYKKIFNIIKGIFKRK